MMCGGSVGDRFGGESESHYETLESSWEKFRIFAMLSFIRFFRKLDYI